MILSTVFLFRIVLIHFVRISPMKDLKNISDSVTIKPIHIYTINTSVYNMIIGNA